MAGQVLEDLAVVAALIFLSPAILLAKALELVCRW